jgi:hypothetical protein
MATAHCCLGQSINAMLPHWHDMSKMTLQTCTPLNDVNVSMAKSKMTDAATTVMEEKHEAE